VNSNFLIVIALLELRLNVLVYLLYVGAKLTKKMKQTAKRSKYLSGRY